MASTGAFFLCVVFGLLLGLLGWGVPKVNRRTRERTLELKALLPEAEYQSKKIFGGFVRMMESNSPYALLHTHFSVDAVIESYGWKPWERRCAILIYAWYADPKDVSELEEGLRTYVNHFMNDHTGRKFTVHLAVRRAKRTKESRNGRKVESW